MVGKLTLALGLMAVSVTMHTAGVTCALRWLRRRTSPAPHLWPGTRWLIGLAAWIILLHLVEMGTHLRRDTVIPQWFQASKAAAASDGHAVHC